MRGERRGEGVVRGRERGERTGERVVRGGDRGERTGEGAVRGRGESNIIPLCCLRPVHQPGTVCRCMYVLVIITISGPQ